MIVVKRKSDLFTGEWLSKCEKAGINPTNNFVADLPEGGVVKLHAFGQFNWLMDAFEVVDGAELVTKQTTDMKFDGDKARVDLLLDGCPNAIEAVSQVLTFGAKKYADHSWQGVDKGPARYKAALLRHLLAHAAGESLDSESGLSHLAHAACNAMFILELELKKDA